MSWAIRVLALAVVCGVGPWAGATNFAVLLCGQGGGDGDACADASKNIREIAIDELNIDVGELRAGDPGLTPPQVEALARGFRVYAPGTPRFGNAKFTSACTLGGSKELQAWFSEAAKGKNIRKNITVRLFTDAGEPLRDITLLDCTPCGYDPCAVEADGTETEVFEVHIGGLDMQDLGARVPPSIQGVVIEKHLFGKEKREAWTEWSGGEPIQHIEGPLAGARYRTPSPGHKSVGAITLSGAADAPRPTLCEMIGDALAGKATPGIVLQEDPDAQRPGKRYTYFDCFPIRYVFPKISAVTSSEVKTETLEVKMGRIELR